MDARVNAFLNEINEIAPLNDKNDCVWEKCYDDDSGYYYYWNTKTNEVTWDMPAEYKSKQHQQQKKKPVSLYMPPRTAPLFPSTSGLIPPVSDAIKIYKIGQSTETFVTNNTTNLTTTTTVITTTTTVPKVQIVEKTPIVKNKEEDKVEINTKLLKEPKVALISSYDDDSDSETENSGDNNKTSNGVIATTTIKSSDNETSKLKNSEEISRKSKNEISGFSLVAGYGSENDDNSDNDDVNKKQKSNDDNKIAHSTLFPITKPISIKDFEESDMIQNDCSDSDNFVDSKAFQRKRRIGVALVNTIKKTKLNDSDENTERKGLGFSKETSIATSTTTKSCKYPGFTSGGVLFVKSNDPPSTDQDDVKNDSKDIQDSYLTLKEKLSFLSEGHEEVSPVQLMLLQLETLYTALKSGDLKQKYLRQWLDDTCGDLIKLEKETTPEGWLLQWDRCHKRYYYQNETTGESQWEYPETDVTRRDEAMDISTTPPPQSSSSSNHEEQSPKISRPTSPVVVDDKKPIKLDIGDLNEGNSEESVSKDTETSTNQTKEINDNLSEALNSFYSDIAAIENSNSPPPPTSSTVSNTNDENKLDTIEAALADASKKKKKTKVKLVQGIAMKKKGVSKLVEKWKNVQLSYSD